MIDIHLPNLKITEFSPCNNVVNYIEEIKRKTTNTNFLTNTLQKIMKKKVNREVYKNLEIQVMSSSSYTVEDILKFLTKKLYLSKEFRTKIN